MIFYNRTIAVPVARSIDDADVERGAAIFEHVGCTGCHTPVQHSAADTAVLSDPRGGNEGVTALADQTTPEDTATGALAFTIGDLETAASALALSATSSDPALVPVANVVFGGTDAARTSRIS